MKKMELSPLALDKETIARLDEKQLNDILGGGVDYDATSTGCGSGGSTCGKENDATSTGCGTGSSTCTAVA